MQEETTAENIEQPKLVNAQVKRNPDGTWPRGQSGNPFGKKRMTWQDFADRVDYYLSHFTRGEIKAMVLNTNEFDKLVMRDAFIVQTMAEGLQSDGLMSREKIIARVIGDAIQKKELSGPEGGAIEFDDAGRRADLRRKLLAPSPNETEAEADSGAEPTGTA